MRGLIRTRPMISDTRASSKKLIAVLLAGVVLVTLLVVVVVVLGAAERSIDGVIGGVGAVSMSAVTSAAFDVVSSIGA